MSYEESQALRDATQGVREQVGALRVSLLGCTLYDEATGRALVSLHYSEDTPGEHDGYGPGSRDGKHLADVVAAELAHRFNAVAAWYSWQTVPGFRNEAPGQWCAQGNEVHDRAASYADGARIGDTPNLIARVEYPYGDEAGQAATARLFAAAPLMLEALHYIVGWRPEGWSGETARDMALAAIALAEGGAMLKPTPHDEAPTHASERHRRDRSGE
jgi:hypothetical protein